MISSYILGASLTLHLHTNSPYWPPFISLTTDWENFETIRTSRQFISGDHFVNSHDLYVL